MCSPVVAGAFGGQVPQTKRQAHKLNCEALEIGDVFIKL